jgi:hypothetical protein
MPLPLGAPLALALILLAGCAPAAPAPLAPAGPLPVQRAADVDARGEDGRWTLYSLRENAVVPAEDSASTRWDLAFRATAIRVNGGASGPGDGAVVILPDTAFAAVTSAPDDSLFAIDEDGGRTAIPAGAGRGWYDYDMATGVIEPRPAVLVVRTADGRFARVRIRSYYRGAPERVDPQHGFRFYTFDYVFQPDGSRRLE